MVHPTVKRFVQNVEKFHYGVTYRAIFLVAYFGFFRLASSVPNMVKTFDKTRYPVFGDVI